MKALLAVLVFVSASTAAADVLGCKLKVNDQVVSAYADRNESAVLQIGETVCTGKRNGRYHEVEVVTRGGFVYSAKSPSTVVAVIDGGSTETEVYARSFCTCSSM